MYKYICIPNIIVLNSTKLRLAQYTPIYTPLPTQYTRDLVPPSNNPAPHPPYKRRMPNVTAYVFFVNLST